MNINELKTVLLITRLTNNGADKIDVFDLMYETSLHYPEMKTCLDSLCSQGHIAEHGRRYYSLCADPAKLSANLSEEYPDGVRKALAELDGAPEPERSFSSDLEERHREIMERLRARRAALEDDDEDDEDLGNDEDDEDEEEDDDGDFDRRLNELLNDSLKEVVPDDEPCGVSLEDYLEEHEDGFTEELIFVLRQAFCDACAKNSKCVGTAHFVYEMLNGSTAVSGLFPKNNTSKVFYNYYYRTLVSDSAVCEGLSCLGAKLLARASQIAQEYCFGERADVGHLLKAILEERESQGYECLKMAKTNLPGLTEELEKFLKSEE